MPTITVKNLPDELYQLIKERAAENRRSVNQEIILRLQHSLQSRRMDPGAFLARADELRTRLALPPLTDERLREARSTGRP